MYSVAILRERLDSGSPGFRQPGLDIVRVLDLMHADTQIVQSVCLFPDGRIDPVVQIALYQLQLGGAAVARERYLPPNLKDRQGDKAAGAPGITRSARRFTGTALVYFFRQIQTIRDSPTPLSTMLY